MPVRPMLLHHMALVSFRLFCKNLGNLQEFFEQMVYRPPWQKIARTPTSMDVKFTFDSARLGFIRLRKHSPNSRCRPSSCLLAVLTMFLAIISPSSYS